MASEEISDKMTKIQKISVNLPEDSRLETGVVQVNQDWPGVFVRGDCAFGYARCLDVAIKNLREYQNQNDNCQDLSLSIAIVNLESLRNLLESSTQSPWSDNDTN
jgi:hypothetical protein